MSDLIVPKYRWSAEVRKFGESRCIFCGSTEKPEAHHVKPKSQFQEYALDLDNGVVLCHRCHKRLHYCGGNEIQKKAEEEVQLRILLAIPKGQKATIEAAAKAVDESVNQYAQTAMLARMGLEEWPELEAAPEE